MGLNLNTFAREVALAEGKKIALPIGQIKEVMKIVLTKLSEMDRAELDRVLDRYREKY